MNQTKKQYKATFILDTRGQERSVDEIVADFKNEIASLDCEVTQVDDLGLRDFARVTDHKFPQGHYVQFLYEGPASSPSDLQEKFRLNPVSYRIVVQAL